MLAIVCECWSPSSNSDTEILVSSLTICTSYSRSLGRRVICDEHAEVVDESSVSHLATSAREIDTIVSILEPIEDYRFGASEAIQAIPSASYHKPSPKASHPSRMSSSPRFLNMPFGHKNTWVQFRP